jgi:hypothetical protein
VFPGFHFQIIIQCRSHQIVVEIEASSEPGTKFGPPTPHPAGTGRLEKRDSLGITSKKELPNDMVLCFSPLEANCPGWRPTLATQDCPLGSGFPHIGLGAELRSTDLRKSTPGVIHWNRPLGLSGRGL